MTQPAGTGATIGIGWRPEIAGYVAALPGLRFTEVVAESVHPAHPPQLLMNLVERGVRVVPHGVRLSLGGAEPVDDARAAHLARCAELLRSPLVSEHIAFVRAGGVEAGHLLPVPRTREAVDAVVANVRRTRAALGGVALALEPIAALFDWPDPELTEAQFLTEILDRTGCGLLLDVANVYANARNRGEDPTALLDALPLERIAYVHVAGGAEHDGFYHDTHTDATPPEVLDLVKELCARTVPPALMLERDGHYPPAADLTRELDALSAAAGLPRITVTA
ncbi:DUF692 domain-containing protein [Dactylosporangium sp. NPDC050688]|uniref:DUF692 domain-containing protein n=1 Tax=Dactylosporangium sp. NPDC050688 TaxID=3157217 RepID=UPI0033E3269B